MLRRYFSKLAEHSLRGNNSQGADLKVLLGFHTKQGNIVVGHPRFFYSIPAAALTRFQLASQTGCTFVSRFDPYKRKNPSIVSAIACSISAPPVSSSSIRPKYRQQTSLMRWEVSPTNLVHKQLPVAGMKFFHVNSFLFGKSRGLHTSTCVSVFPGVESDEFLEKNLSGDVLASADENISLEKSIKLLCGSSYLPHPDKEETGGEDAHFIREHVIGVADGVGGWADQGVDAGKYSRELMLNAEAAILEEPISSIDPARVLEKAYAKTKSKGSSTACIIALTDQGLRAINLGDSGFMVIRDGSTVFKSPFQQHDFNFPYQLESGSGRDQPSSGEVFKVQVCPGDVIVAGTDGLFDNLYNYEVSAVVVHCVRAGFGPEVAAREMAALARERALDKNRQTPFAQAAQDAGLRYHGGKLDDITVIVSYITTPANGSSRF